MNNLEEIRKQLDNLNSEHCNCGVGPHYSDCGPHGEEQYFLLRCLCYFCLGKKCERCNQTGLTAEIA